MNECEVTVKMDGQTLIYTDHCVVLRADRVDGEKVAITISGNASDDDLIAFVMAITELALKRLGDTRTIEHFLRSLEH